MNYYYAGLVIVTFVSTLLFFKIKRASSKFVSGNLGVVSFGGVELEGRNPKIIVLNQLLRQQKYAFALFWVSASVALILAVFIVGDIIFVSELDFELLRNVLLLSFEGLFTGISRNMYINLSDRVQATVNEII